MLITYELLRNPARRSDLGILSRLSRSLPPPALFPQGQSETGQRLGDRLDSAEFTDIILYLFSKLCKLSGVDTSPIGIQRTLSNEALGRDSCRFGPVISGSLCAIVHCARCVFVLMCVDSQFGHQQYHFVYMLMPRAHGVVVSVYTPPPPHVCLIVYAWPYAYAWRPHGPRHACLVIIVLPLPLPCFLTSLLTMVCTFMVLILPQIG